MSTKRSTGSGRARRTVILVAAFATVVGLFAAPATARPFVTFSKTAVNPTIEAGDVAAFTIEASNTGTSAANNVVISDVLPDSGLAWAENPDVSACSIADDPGGDVLTCTIASLAIGATFSVTLEAATNPEACDYVLTNTASLTVGGRGRKSATASISVTCPPQDGGCTFTQGFWKNHPEVWPVSSLALGSVTYTAAELGQIFDEPVAGNGLISLAHQLIAAKLNVANGADDSDIAQAIADADALINGLVVPPIGSGSLDPDDTSALVDALTDFNEGTTGPGHCEEEEEEGGEG